MDKLRAFQILDCEPTDDLRTIKKAYAKKIKEVHPEVDPEGFLLVKEAYEFLKEPRLVQSTFVSNEEIFTQEPKVQQPKENIILERKVEEDEELYDFDELLEKEDQKQQLIVDTLARLQETLSQPKLKKGQLEMILNQQEVQSFIYSEAFIQQLISLIESVKLHPTAKKVLIKTYHLKKPKTALEKELKERIKNNNRNQMTYILPVLVVIFMNAIRAEADADTGILMICMALHLLFVVTIFIVNKRKNTLAKTFLNTTLAYLGMYVVFTFVLALNSESAFSFYFDVFTPPLFILLPVAFVFGIYSLYIEIKQKWKGRKR